MTFPNRLDVFIVEDDPAHMERLCHNLTRDGQLNLVGAFATGLAALDAVAELLPDVALVDLGLPDMDGFELIRRIRASCPSTDVLVVSVFGSEYHLLHAIEAGATGYLLRRCIGMVPTNPSPDPKDRGLLSQRETAILQSIASSKAKIIAVPGMKPVAAGTKLSVMNGSIVAGGAGNIVAGGAGNIVAGGAGN